MKCSVAACDCTVRYAGTLCKAHKKQAARGSQLHPIRPKNSNDRFWSKVSKNGLVVRSDLGPCWPWTACRYSSGHGRFTTTTAHRRSWEIHFGPIPTGLSVLHRCDNPPCVNPAHLFLGTQADNLADMRAKGRQAVGERSGQAVLTDANAAEIKRRYKPGVIRQKDLAAEFGVCRQTIGNIVTGTKWRHVA